MIGRHETDRDKLDIWARIAAPVAPESIQWRQDGRPVTRDGKTIARFVCYIEANTVRERLDSVVPGEWDLTLELLPPVASVDESAEPVTCSFKARLQIMGVIREDVGTGKDFKQASTDAFKRAAVRFGIGHELYDYDQNWVELDGDGKWAKPVEDPAKVYARKHGARSARNGDAEYAASGTEPIAAQSAASKGAALPTTNVATNGKDDPSCPICGSRMWDNRADKRNPRAPDFKCRDRSCEGVIWPPKADGGGAKGGKAPVSMGDDIPGLADDDGPPLW